MNQDTLVLLSGMAPRVPEQWALDEWRKSFTKDYPAPWHGDGFGAPSYELWSACEACLRASGCREDLVSEMTHRHFKKNSPDMHYIRWRDECEAEWTRHGWPLLWAKKRMQAAGVA